ncbi:hypothetical protein AAU61_17015 [Desulfocarbo indianensis]|nr:hypothetical protein AAU61_17015 [Desulfocarbo indianensis]
MPDFAIEETVNRLAKRALDTGEAASIPEADALLHSYRLAFVIGEQEASQAQHQAALLTGVNLARRSFLGGVSVQGNLMFPCWCRCLWGKPLTKRYVLCKAALDLPRKGCPL